MNPIEARMYLDGRRRRTPTLEELAEEQAYQASLQQQMEAQRKLQLQHEHRRQTPGHQEYASEARSDLWGSPAQFIANTPFSMVPGLGDMAEYQAAREQGYGVPAAVGLAALPFGAASTIMKAAPLFKATDPKPALKSRELLLPEYPIDDFLNMAEKLAKADPVKTKRVNRMLEAGEEFDVPFLRAENMGDYAQTVGHEGRHRAMALRARGYSTMPVVLKVTPSPDAQGIRWTEQFDPDKFDFVRNWPRKLRGEDGGELDFPVTREQVAEVLNERLDLLPKPPSGTIDDIMDLLR